MATFLGYPDLYSWLHDWLPIIFMGLLVVAIFGLIRFMPRTNPAKIKPDAAPPIGWDEIAGEPETPDVTFRPGSSSHGGPGSPRR